MPLDRVFLDWQCPILPAAAEYLIGRYTRGEEIDLREAIIVLPGNEAGRRLQQLLLERADRSGKVFLPPRVHTESTLPERLYKPQRPAASDFTQLFVWAEVLRSAKPAELVEIVPNPPRPEATARWLDLARLLKKQHEDLAREGYVFGHVARCSAVKELPEEEHRWQAMHRLQERYLNRIDALGFWDRQTARRVAIEKNECRTEKDIILIGTVDLLKVLRDMLDQAASKSPGRITALVHAPPSLAERFDEHGCVVTKAWLGAELPFEESQIVRVGGANEQAAAVAHELAALGNRYRADQITVGLPDESLAPSIDRKLRQHGLQTRFIGQTTLAQSGPLKLLSAVAAYLGQRDFTSFAALVRHPDVFAWLTRQLARKNAAEAPPDILSALDTYYTQRLPSDFDLRNLKIDESYLVSSIVRKLKKLLEPLLTGPAPPAAWLPPIRDLLTKTYAQAEFDRENPADRPATAAFKNLATAFEKLESVPGEIAPKLSAAEAIALGLERFGETPVPPPRDPAAIEMLGWLELPQDDAPVLLVTTFNEGRVPSYVVADLFLPEPIRRELGVGDNDRRYARDAYATSVLLHSREQVKFIVARRNVAGDPLTPSRLLFAADKETVARRALRIFSDESPSLPASVPPVPLPPRTMLPIPPAEPIAELAERFSVSAFKSYLACPYRYYLQYVLRLVELSDTSQELEANTFGTLLHDCLDAFGRDEDVRLQHDPGQIVDYLNAQLDELAQRQLLSRSRGAIAVQIEQLRRRLDHFAQWQAARVQEGWQIRHVEKKIEAAWEVDGRPVVLHGRVDRIDVHATTGQIMVFDYKSGDAANTPERAHRKKKQQWVDLQLPLYRHLARAAGLEGDVGLGYIALPKDVTKIGHLAAEWSAGELAEADEIARQVIRDVWAGKFEPLSREINPRWDSFAAICQSRSLGQRPVASDEEEMES